MKRESGFVLPTAIFLLVILAALAALFMEPAAFCAAWEASPAWFFSSFLASSPVLSSTLRC